MVYVVSSVGPRAGPPRAGPGSFGSGRPGPLTLGPRPARPETGPGLARAGPKKARPEPDPARPGKPGPARGLFGFFLVFKRISNETGLNDDLHIFFSFGLRVL